MLFVVMDIGEVEVQVEIHKVSPDFLNGLTLA